VAGSQIGFVVFCVKSLKKSEGVGRKGLTFVKTELLVNENDLLHTSLEISFIIVSSHEIIQYTFVFYLVKILVFGNIVSHFVELIF